MGFPTLPERENTTAITLVKDHSIHARDSIGNHTDTSCEIAPLFQVPKHGMEKSPRQTTFEPQPDDGSDLTDDPASTTCEIASPVPSSKAENEESPEANEIDAVVSIAIEGTSVQAAIKKPFPVDFHDDLEADGNESPYLMRPRSLPPKGPVPKVLYTTEYRTSTRSGVIFTEETKKTSSITAKDDRPVIEVVEVAVTRHEMAFYDRPDREKAPTVHWRSTSYIRINSKAIINALRHVVNYYPSLSLAGDSINIDAPYAVLIHYEKELSVYREEFAPDRITEDNGECENEDAYEHIGLLQDVVNELMGEQVKKERERHTRKIPVATYEMLWLLFQPGTDIYLDKEMDNDFSPYVVKSVEFSLKNGSVQEYNINVWNMSSDTYHIGPSEYKLQPSLTKFDGEKEITSMQLYPCSYATEDKNGGSDQERWDHFVRRGKMYFRLQRKCCMWFDGFGYTYPRRKYVGMVMVDPEELRSQRPLDLPSFDPAPYGLDIDPPSGSDNPSGKLSDDLESVLLESSTCKCKRCCKLQSHRRKTSRFVGYSRINPLRAEGLTEHQYFLCERAVDAFVFKTREWQWLEVTGFSECKFQKRMMDDLVLGPKTKNMILNLVKMYVRKEPAQGDQKAPLAYDEWSSDSIHGKGEGLIFLLHGKPGVGKTLTAECVAEHTARPLLTLTCADIGTDPMTIEKNLVNWFKLARRWGAILLIDEADIYMESREAMDLKRNSIVASFLRTMEYYRGILLLTTNRIGTFDEAVLSRVHILLHYREFTDNERQKVWKTFFNKLERERGKTMRVTRSTKDYVLESKEVKELKWNGREIRNAFQIAIALAESEGELDEDGCILVKEEHIQATAQMSHDFKQYLMALHKKNDSALASMRGIRYDAFESKDDLDG